MKVEDRPISLALSDYYRRNRGSSRSGLSGRSSLIFLFSVGWLTQVQLKKININWLRIKVEHLHSRLVVNNEKLEGHYVQFQSLYLPRSSCSVCGMTCTDIDQRVQLEEKNQFTEKLRLNYFSLALWLVTKNLGTFFTQWPIKSYRGLHTSTRRSLLESGGSYGLSIKDVLLSVAMLRRWTEIRCWEHVSISCLCSFGRRMIPEWTRGSVHATAELHFYPLQTLLYGPMWAVEPCFSSSSIIPIPNRSHCCHKFPPLRHPRSLSCSPLGGLLRFC